MKIESIWIGFCVSIFIVLSVARSVASDAVKIHVEFVDVVDRSSAPAMKNIHVHNKFDVALKTDGSISQRFIGRTSNDGYVHDEAGGLGSKAAGNVVWRVESAHHLVGVTDYPNHQRLISIQIDGKQCKASVAHPLKPGKTIYLAPRLSSREMATYTRRKTLSSLCRISSEN